MTSNATLGQIAIALLSEARMLYDRTSSGRNRAMQREEVMAVADRVSRCAAELKDLELRHADNVTALAAERNLAQAKLGRVVQLCKDNSGLNLAREILEVLND